LCFFLFELLELATTKKDCVGCDQFVFYDATDPKKCLAPDGFVKLGVRPKAWSSWRVWEHGAPELCVEIVSGSDREPIPMKEKLVRYQTTGTRELVLFDHEARPGARLRVFDRIDGDFVERVVENDGTPCLTLGLHWVVAPAPELDVALRLARDAEGVDVLFSAKEQLEKLRAAR
jgi:Uma2 family endonuclease